MQLMQLLLVAVDVDTNEMTLPFAAAVVVVVRARTVVEHVYDFVTELDALIFVVVACTAGVYSAFEPVSCVAAVALDAIDSIVGVEVVVGFDDCTFD